MSKTRADFRIVAPDPHSRTARVWMDGELLKGVDKVTLELDFDRANRITIRFIANSVNAETTAEVPDEPV